jgi:hypothetical protein
MQTVSRRQVEIGDERIEEPPPGVQDAARGSDSVYWRSGRPTRSKEVCDPPGKHRS